MNHRRIKEQIDACRAGSDDLHLPELAQLAERVESDPQVRHLYEQTQQHDGAIAGTMRQVPVPEGLAERLLAKLAAQRGEADTGLSDPLGDVDLHAAPPADADGAGLAAPARVPPALVSRRFWLGTTVTTAAVAILVAMGLWLTGEEPLSADAVVEKVRDMIGKDLRHVRWQANPETAPSNYPFPLSINQDPRRWGWLDASHLAAQAVVYDLAADRDAPAVMLLVFRPRSVGQDLPLAPHIDPQSSTGGWSIGTWQEDDLVYVLIVKGPRVKYQRLIKPPPPLAALPRYRFLRLA